MMYSFDIRMEPRMDHDGSRLGSERAVFSSVLHVLEEVDTTENEGIRSFVIHYRYGVTVRAS